MLKYALVARGDAELYLRLPKAGYQEKIWDHGAGALIVEEAGGTATDLEGKPVSFDQPPFLNNAPGLAVSNGPCHAAILAAVKACREAEG
jgi:3'(2'), 5'-bisphosphate nucleotidase